MTLPPDADPGQPLSPPMHSKGPPDDAAVPDTFPVVGIGASAGGLEALKRLLPTLPIDAGMAYLVVLHLDPSRESHLTEILGRATEMPVLEARHHQRVEPNQVYIIPPNVGMAVGGGVLHLVPRGEVRAPHLPVDYLFRSMSEDIQSRAIGVVLSGTGTDGTQGICEIKAVGGITFAQAEDTAQFGGMPHSTIGSGCVDFVLPPEEIGARLSSIGAHPYLAVRGPSVSPMSVEFDGFYRTVLDLVERATGVDFSQYRDTTLKRRIMRRMALHGDRQVADYVQRLECDDGEAEGLYHDLLINVTSFFRDAELFESLKVQVFPEITKGKSPTTPLRVWVPGCSTGQEAYSLAISLVEYFDDKPYRPPVQIFATDLAESTALDRARQGVFPESIEGEVSPERLQRFFRKEGHAYHIDKSIREMCVFARHNVTADPPFSHLDLISCRNVLIYLGMPLQRRVVPTFHYALNVPGFLVLGAAETVGDAGNDMFSLTDREHKIYLKRPVVARPPMSYRSSDFRLPVAGPGQRTRVSSPPPLDFQREADRILLGRYAPPAVLVNRYLDIVQFRGKTGDYLEAPAGEPTLNLLKMAREGLFLELRSALAEAEKQGVPVRRQNVRVRRDGVAAEIDLEILPVRSTGNGDQCFLVIFHEDDPSSPKQVEPPQPLEPEVAERELTHLRQELSSTREYMQALLEQQDALNEELRQTNAEILSSNEELQSTNEELETAKEELQSANEELTTVNEQLQHRNLELSQANADFANLLGSVNLPVLMVGADLRVRRFTSPATKVLGLQPSDVGRPIAYLRLPRRSTTSR
jgi:two-component system CheB/CheR fusion protein